MVRTMLWRARDLRKNGTRSEAILWDALRDRRLGGVKWRRQAVVGRFVVDFLCVQQKLVIEIDGGVHAGRQEADAERQRALEVAGLRVVRFTAREVEEHIDDVLARIASL